MPILPGVSICQIGLLRYLCRPRGRNNPPLFTRQSHDRVSQILLNQLLLTATDPCLQFTAGHLIKGLAALLTSVLIFTVRLGHRCALKV